MNNSFVLERVSDKHYSRLMWIRKENIILAVAHFNHFSPILLCDWHDCDIGEHICNIMTDSDAEVYGCYIFFTENGDSDENIKKVIEIIEKNEGYEDPTYGIAQCHNCQCLAGVGNRFPCKTFNMIPLYTNRKCDKC